MAANECAAEVYDSSVRVGDWKMNNENNGALLATVGSAEPDDDEEGFRFAGEGV